jgi:choline/glycine/proline betaine transport protein
MRSAGITQKEIFSQHTINKPVFFSSTLVIATITLLGTFWPTQAELFFKTVQDWLTVNTSWIYMVGVGTILFFSIWLMVSRMGDIKLGPDHSVPDYPNLSWFSMLFSAGMGIGLLFFGVAEPLMHFSNPPVGEALSVQTAQEAMKITFFHWGLHAWAIYAVLGVILAFFCLPQGSPPPATFGVLPPVGIKNLWSSR